MTIEGSKDDETKFSITISTQNIFEIKSLTYNYGQQVAWIDKKSLSGSYYDYI